LIDPYGVWQSNSGFPRKVAASDKVRQIKSYQGMRYSPEVLIVGNSRVEIGLPPEHPFYQGKVYNLGLPGAGVLMQYDYAWHLIQTGNNIQQVLVAVDFVDFLSVKPSGSKLVGSWQARLNYYLAEPYRDNKNYWVQGSEQFQLAFSQSAIVDSLKTIISQSQDLNATGVNGFNDGRLYHNIVKNEGFSALYRQKIDELQKRLQRDGLKFDTSGREFLALDSFLKLLTDKGITVTLFINPYQYHYLDLIEKNGLEQTFIDWKLNVQQFAARYNLALYDFAIRSELVSAAAVLKSKKLEDNPFFWEPAHYRPTFGVLMLDVFLQQNCTIEVNGAPLTLCQLTLSKKI